MTDLPIAANHIQISANTPIWIAILVYLVITASMASVILTRLIRDWSRRVNFVDHPDGRRKVHRKPVALGGGLAIFLATVLGVGLTAMLSQSHESFSGNW